MTSQLPGVSATDCLLMTKRCTAGRKPDRVQSPHGLVTRRAWWERWEGIKKCFSLLHISNEDIRTYISTCLPFWTVIQ